jgi:hypothetical protein
MCPVWRISALKTPDQTRNISFNGIIFPQLAHRSKSRDSKPQRGQNGTPREHRGWLPG